MSLLEEKLIELDFLPHADLHIAWPSFIEESISTETRKGYINIKYSDVPDFVYILASKLGTEFLPKKILDEAKSKSFIFFADEKYTELAERINLVSLVRRGLWKSLNDEKQKDKILNDRLRYLKEKLPDCEYIGLVSSSSEYSTVDILAKKSDVYISQRENILRLSEDLAKEILKRILEHYGVVVSPALRPLLEK